MREVTSKRMKGVTELTLVAKIKPGLVDVRETRSYATRLRILLRTLFAIRQKGVEEAIDANFAGPLERLQILHFVRFSIFDGDSKLLLAASFDGPWEPYIRKIADAAGPLLDVIFCNCDKYDDHASDLGYQKFAEWVREHQVESEFFFAGAPEVSADDVRYLKKLEEAQHQGGENFDELAAKLRVFGPDEEAQAIPTNPARLQAARLRALQLLHGLRELYPGDPRKADRSRDHLFLLRTAKLILEGLRREHLSEDELKLHGEALSWLESPDPPQEASRKRRSLERPEIVQGNILEPYEGMTHGCLLLMGLGPDAAEARAFLRRLHVTGAQDKPGDGDFTLNVGFTCAGLRALGMPEAELAQLPREFREGMEARAGWLGDVGPNHPSRWELPRANWPVPTPGEAPRPAVRLSSVDLVILLQTRRKSFEKGDHLWSAQHPLYKIVSDLASGGGVQLLAVEPLRRKPLEGKDGTYEHFGFRDGISQPTHEAKEPERDRVSLGELLLGYADDHGDREEVPLGVLDNGSFLVIRKLRQDVSAFRTFLKGKKVSESVLAAKMMGRDFDGHPTVDPERPATDNDFDYERDPEGAGCPFHAHIRRANPRNGPALAERPRKSNIVPRIARRGFSYGARYDEAPEDKQRGLFFMAYNASIADQFEVIQGWIAGGNSTGVLSAHNDPLLGLPQPGKRRTLRFHHDGEVIRCDMGDKPFVTLEWGLYLLVPSTAAVQQLADYLERKPEPDPDLVEGNRVIEALQTMRLLEQRAPKKDQTAFTAWKKLLEDVSARETARAVWTAVRARGGVLRTPYGVLVGKGDLVMQVFRDHRTFSVGEYGRRMQQSLGLHYLGMDPALEPGAGVYAEESRAPNAWIAGVRPQDAFALAANTTAQIIERLRKAMPEVTLIDLRRFVPEIVAHMSKRWFAIPDGQLMQVGGTPGATAHCPHDFGATARYIFSPNPTGFVEKEGRDRGRKLLEATRSYVRQAIEEDSVPAGSLFEALYRGMGGPGSAVDQDQIARVLVGSVHGFVAPAGGSCFSVLHQWTADERLWRYQQALLARKGERPQEPDYDRAQAVLLDGIVRTLQVEPFPYVLHRTALCETELGGVKVEEGERVVLGLVSATQDQPGGTEILLGGKFGTPEAPVHACPGWGMACGTILGVASTLLQAGSLGREGSTVLSLRPLERSAA